MSAKAELGPLLRRRSCRAIVFLSGIALAGCSTLNLSPPTGPSASAAPQQSVEKAPKPSGAAPLRNGDAFRTAGDFADAAILYRQALTLDPSNLDAALRLADTERLLNDTDNAVAVYRYAQSLAPDNPDIAYRLIELFLLRGDTSAAMDQFQVALKSADNPKLYNALGVTYSMQGSYSLAKDMYQRGLALDPQNPSLRNNYGLAQLSTNDLTGALATFTSLMQTPQRSDRYRLNLALVLMALGKTAEAKATAGDLMDEASMRQALLAYRPSPPPDGSPDRHPRAKPSVAVAAAATPGLHVLNDDPGNNTSPISAETGTATAMTAQSN